MTGTQNVQTNHCKYNDVFLKIFRVFLIINSSNIFIKQCFPSTPLLQYISPLLGMIFLLFFLMLVRRISILKRLFLFEFAFFLIMIFSILRNSEIFSEIVSHCMWTFLFCIPLAIVAYEVNDWDYVLNKVAKVTVVCSIISIINIFLFELDRYNMALGYSMMPLVLIQIKVSEQKKRYWLLVVLQIVLIMIFCSRGSLMCIGVYFIYQLFAGRKNRKHTVLKFLMCVGGLFILCFYQFVAKLVFDIMNDLGLYSRTLELLAAGRVLFDSGRTDIGMMLLKHLFDSPLLGLGVGGELKYISSSPHLLFLELLLHYGCLFGVLIIIAVCIVIIRAFKKEKSTRDALALLVCGGFLHLFLSSSYLQTPIFWILISMCLKIVKSKKERRG